MIDKLSTEYQSTIICPHCNHSHDEPHEISGNDEDGEHECHNCGKNYIWNAHREVTYSTYKQEES